MLTRLLIILSLIAIGVSSKAQHHDTLCKTMYQHIAVKEYNEVISMINDGAPCECYDSYRYKRSAPKFWFPGWLIATVAHSFSRGTLVEYSLTSKTIQQPVSPERDSLLMLLTKKNSRYNSTSVDNYLRLYLKSDPYNSNPELFNTMYKRATYTHRKESYNAAVSVRHNAFIKKFIPTVNWRKDGLMVLKATISHDTIALLDEILESKKVSVNAKYGHSYNTLLHDLINPHHRRNGFTDQPDKMEKVLAVLKKHKYNFDLTNADRETPLHLAISCESKFLFDWLLQQKINIHRTNEAGMTYLHLAVKKNNYHMVQQLIEHGVNINKKDRYGDKAVDYASQYQPRILKELGAPYDTIQYNSQYLLRMASLPEVPEVEKPSIEKIISDNEYSQHVITKVYKSNGYQSSINIISRALDSRNLYMIDLLLDKEDIVLEDRVEWELKQVYKEVYSNNQYGLLRKLIKVCPECASDLADKVYNSLGYYYKSYSSRKRPAYLDSNMSVLNDTRYLPFKDSNGLWHYGANTNYKKNHLTYDSIVPFNEAGFSLFKKNGRWGIHDISLKEVLQYKYDEIVYVNNYEGFMGPHFVFLGKSGNQTTIVDIEKFISYDVEFEAQLPPHHEIEEFKFGKHQMLLKTRYLNAKGLSIIRSNSIKVIYEPEYNEVELLPNSIVAVKQLDKWSLQEARYYTKLKFKWHEYRVTKDDLIEVRKGKRWKPYKYK